VRQTAIPRHLATQKAKLMVREKSGFKAGLRQREKSGLDRE